MVAPRLLRRRITVGPWPCEACGFVSQYTEIRPGINYVFCRNPNCRYNRWIDKRHHRIIENDGTCWEYDGNGNKRQVRLRA